jgi:hypothetical protein
MRADQSSPESAALVATAKRLRAVRRASRQFLALWALEQGQRTPRAGSAPSNADEAKLADPMNHDWSLLYLGNILDD